MLSMTDSKAVKLLKKDHREVEKLFKQYEHADETSEKIELARKICQALTLHAHIEEKAFYPALTGKVGQDMLDEAKVEHASLKELIAKIDGASPADALFDAHVKVLMEYVMHHVKEEEHEIMPKAESSGVDLNKVGEQLQDLKTRLEAKLANLVPEPGVELHVQVLQIDGRGVLHH